MTTTAATKFVYDPAGKKAYVRKAATASMEFQFRYDQHDFYIEPRSGRYVAIERLA